MRKRHWFFLVLTLVLLFLIFLEPRWGWQASNFLRSGMSSKSGMDTTMLAENQKLKAEIIRLEAIQDQAFWDSEDYISAVVFARYPFNLKSELLVDVKSEGGVRAGQAVLLAYQAGSERQAILLGRVAKVFRESVLIETIFDPSWQSSVKIGKKGILALLKGGNEPRVTLIPKEAVISPGDVVYSVDPELPHTAVLGEIYDLSLSSDQVFQEGRLKLVYDFNDLKAVSILKNEPPRAQ